MAVRREAASGGGGAGGGGGRGGGGGGGGGGPMNIGPLTPIRGSKGEVWCGRRRRRGKLKT